MHNLFDDRSKCFAHVEGKISNWLHDERARDKGAGETNKNYSNGAASSEVQLIEGSAIFGATVNVLHLRAGIDKSELLRYFG